MPPTTQPTRTKNGARLIFWRRLVQTVVFFLLVYIIWTTKYPLKGFIHPGILFQMDPLVMGITALAERVWLSGWFWTALTLGVTLVWGRVFCGWFCPLGTVMDAVAAVTYRFKRQRESEPTRWQWSKYILLALLAALGLAGLQWIWLFDPLTIFVRAFSFNLHPAVNQGVDQLFAWALNATHDYAPLETLYYQLKDAVLDISHPVFPHAGVIGWIFVAILGLVLVQRRFWCRYICPLGALLGSVARWSWYRREVSACRTGCATCRHVCRTNAIRTDTNYSPSECVMCFDCLRACPGQTARFTYRRPTRPRRAQAVPPTETQGISRAQFFLLAGGSLLLTARQSSAWSWAPTPRRARLLRPPGALPEAEFVQRCVRCGNCMKVCLTNVLQPAVMESGVEGIWTPYLAPSIAYCEHQCNLCGQVCPTGAIQPLTLEEKRRTKLGLAQFHHDLCIPWASDKQCLVCEEHCPVASKAIKVVEQRNARGVLMRRPVVDPVLCVGCAICENKCPVRPQRAVTVRPV